MDQQQRQQALDLTRSFIVQAPAGSGKTELLIQRYLALLGQAVESPEEIIAITFTKKAATEMRERIILALQKASGDNAPTLSNQLKTFKLAQQVLQQDARRNWRLLSNPNRLSIQTIDALALRLVTHKPLLAALGGEPKIAEQPKILYQQAARELLASLESNTSWAIHLEVLLRHLHNQWPLAENLFASMLARREQWLPTIMSLKDKPNIRAVLEANLARINDKHLKRLKTTIPQNLFKEIIELQNFTKELDKQNWLAMAELLLTKEGEWRKRSPNKALIESLSQDDSIRQLLAELRSLPAYHYSDRQWRLIDALIHLLPLAVAQLAVIFKDKGVVDFTEVHFAAERTLQSEEEFPSDLSLQLDYQLKHLLVDEFQDTSFSQGHFLQLLINGWQNDDGKTLFLVGDPMQSIYRFRQAEVGLFLEIQQKQQFGQIEVEALDLTDNYRAVPELIKWNNQIFEEIFPKTADATVGAVPFKPSSVGAPLVGASLGQAQGLPLQSQNNILPILQSLQNNHPNDSIAILVRARTHLVELLPQLKQAGIPYHAVEIETLDNTVVVQDCLTLTRALLSPADRIAWLALLRAPWCGLTLSDLLVIAEEKLIWKALSRFEELHLSASAKVQLQKLVPILQEAFAERGRKPLRPWIEGTWQKLGGPACVENSHELAYAEAFFTHLEHFKWDTEETIIEVLKNRLQTLFAEPEPSFSTKLQIMTIHRAKGLEFDHVIVPNLERKPNHNEPPLLLWSEKILGTIKRVGEDADSIYSYLQYLEKQKTAQETIRLLYVAATRAKKTLHWLADVPQKENWSPAEGSLLALLWPWFKEASVMPATALIQDINNPTQTTTYKRLAPHWRLPVE